MHSDFQEPAAPHCPRSPIQPGRSHIHTTGQDDGGVRYRLMARFAASRRFTSTPSTSKRLSRWCRQNNLQAEIEQVAQDLLWCSTEGLIGRKRSAVITPRSSSSAGSSHPRHLAAMLQDSTPPKWRQVGSYRYFAPALFVEKITECKGRNKEAVPDIQAGATSAARSVCTPAGCGRCRVAAAGRSSGSDLRSFPSTGRSSRRCGRRRTAP